MRPRRPSRLQATLRLRQGAGRRDDGARVRRRKRKPMSAVPTAERLPRCALSLRAALARCCAFGSAACAERACSMRHIHGSSYI